MIQQHEVDILNLKLDIMYHSQHLMMERIIISCAMLMLCIYNKMSLDINKIVFAAFGYTQVKPPKPGEDF